MLTVRQEIEKRLAAGVMVAPQWSETVLVRTGPLDPAPLTIPNCFVDRLYEEGPNQTYGDGPNPATEKGRRLRTTYIAELPAPGVEVAPSVVMPDIVTGYQIKIDGVWFNYVRHTGRDSAKQTIRVVYSIPDYSRRPALAPNGPAHFTRKT